MFFCSFIYLAPSCFDPGLFPCSLGGSFTNPEALYQFVEKDKERRGSLGSLLCRFFSSCGKDFFCAIGMWAPLWKERGVEITWKQGWIELTGTYLTKPFGHIAVRFLRIRILSLAHHFRILWNKYHWMCFETRLTSIPVPPFKRIYWKKKKHF